MKNSLDFRKMKKFASYSLQEVIDYIVNDSQVPEIYITYKTGKVQVENPVKSRGGLVSVNARYYGASINMNCDFSDFSSQIDGNQITDSDLSDLVETLRENDLFKGLLADFFYDNWGKIPFSGITHKAEDFDNFINNIDSADIKIVSLFKRGKKLKICVEASYSEQDEARAFFRKPVPEDQKWIEFERSMRDNNRDLWLSGRYRNPYPTPVRTEYRKQ